MAKDTHDREDLLRDATGYDRRIEFISQKRSEPIFCGFRECGALSIYLGQDSVLQFNADGELRRAFWQDRMLASYRHVLNWLERSDGRVRLSRTPLSEEEFREFLAEAMGWLRSLRDELAGQQLTVQGQFPNDADVTDLVMNWLTQASWLEQTDADIPCAMHPGLARGKKAP